MKRLTLIALSALVSGCVMWTPSSPDSVSSSAVVLAVPVYEQEGRYECGNAALAMLLAYYAHTPDAERATALKAKAEESQGLSGAEMTAFLEAEGFEAVIFPGDLSNEVAGVYYHLDRHRPLIVCVSNDDEARHFVLVTGYDPETELLFLQDPRRGGVSIAAWQFDVLWKRCDRFTLLAVPAN